jgi:hypothetical protein
MRGDQVAAHWLWVQDGGTHLYVRHCVLILAVGASSCGIAGTASLEDLEAPDADLETSDASTPSLNAHGGPDVIHHDAGHPEDASLRLDATIHADAGVGFDAHTPDAFRVAAHPPLPQIPNLGGPRLTHPGLVVITFADDPDRALFEAHARWIVTSHWLASVGPEYGIGFGSILATARSASAAPSIVSDAEIQAMLASGIRRGRLPQPIGHAPAEALYVVYYPAQTTILLPDGQGGNVASCMTFGGYHDESHPAVGPSFSYAVIARCPSPDPNLTDLVYRLAMFTWICLALAS